MAERFTRTYTLPEGLYTPGAPVLIAAGALLKDNQTGQMLAQLKIKNISAKEIKATTVKLIAFDTAERKLEAGAEQQYLDLKVARDNYFGETVPIVIADNSARSYEVAVTEVVFADNTIWSGTDTPWQKQITLTPLSTTLTDPELITQYAINLEKEIGLLKCLPQEQEDLWICTCGAINHKEETACYSCESELNTLKATLDIKKLEADKDARLEAARQKAEAEAKEKAEKAAKAKEKTKRLTKYAVCAAVIAIAIGVGISTFQSSNLKNTFEEAVATQRIGDTISAGFYYTIGLKSDGTVVAAGRNGFGQCKVSKWKGIISIVADYDHTVGLKADGTVVATGDNEYGQCKVSSWKDIVAISAGSGYTVGLKSDGTVVAVGSNYSGKCNVTGWKDIVAVSAGSNYTVGLKADGTVVATGDNDDGQCNVEEWADIVAISAGNNHTIGLKSDGTVVATGDNDDGQCDVSGWKDITVPEK